MREFFKKIFKKICPKKIKVNKVFIESDGKYDNGCHSNSGTSYSRCTFYTLCDLLKNSKARKANRGRKGDSRGKQPCQIKFSVQYEPRNTHAYECNYRA